MYPFLTENFLLILLHWSESKFISGDTNTVTGTDSQTTFPRLFVNDEDICVDISTPIENSPRNLMIFTESHSNILRF